MRDRRLGMDPSDARNYNHHKNHVVIPLTRQLADTVMFISLGLQATTSRFDSARLRKIANILREHHLFPPEMESGEQAEKQHTNDELLRRSG